MLADDESAAWRTAATHILVVMVARGSRAVRDGLVWIGWAL
jgi:hypothetical protein